MKKCRKQLLSLGLVVAMLLAPATVQADELPDENATIEEITALAGTEAEIASEAEIATEFTTEIETQTEASDTADDDVVIEENDKPYLALGADLDADQLATVLGLLGVDAAQLANYEVSYVNNSEEHTYLDAYIDSSKIGTKSWSSVVIVQREEGSGINISTKNINYCTVSMYKNALVTAGIKDADIIVAGPKPISGTAALVGIFKAYTQMTGNEISADSIDTALNELVLTGQLKDATGADSDEIEGMVAYLKQKVAEGALKDEESMNQAIDDACEEFKVTLSDDEKAQLLSLLKKIDELDLDPDALIDQAKSIYDQLSNLGIDTSSGIGATIKNFFSGIVESIKSFFANLF